MQKVVTLTVEVTDARLVTVPGKGNSSPWWTADARVTQGGYSGTLRCGGGASPSAAQANAASVALQEFAERMQLVGL